MTDGYEEIRGTLGDPYAALPSEELEPILESAGFSPEDLEDLFGTLAKAGQTIGGGVQRAVPYAAPVAGGALQGATAGAALGPYGMLGGALVGGVGSLIRPGQKPPAPPPAAGRPPVGGLPMSIGVPALPQGVPAAGQLLSAMYQPQVQQALMALLLGQLGTRTVAVGSTQVPVAAIPNMLGALASRAAAQYHETIGQRGDATLMTPTFSESEDPQERADDLLALLQEEASASGSWEESFAEEEEAMPFDAYEPVLRESWEES